jgi:hypothetical protein
MLEQWGKWAYHGRGLVIYYPSIEPFARMAGSKTPEPCITDAEGMLIDRIVAELIKRHPQEGEAVAIYHLNAGSFRRLGKLTHVDDKTAARRYQAGTMWIDGRLVI